MLTENPGELFLDHFWIITSWSPREMNAARLLEFYSARGRMEACIGELNAALAPRLSSVNRAKSHVRNQPVQRNSKPREAAWANQATFMLYALAYNLGSLTRHLERRGSPRSLRSLQDWLIRTPARISRTARRIHVHVTAPLATAFERLRLALSTAQRRLPAHE